MTSLPAQIAPTAQQIIDAFEEPQYGHELAQKLEQCWPIIKRALQQHERLVTEIAEMEAGYKNAAELVLTYHGKNERLEAVVTAARDLLRYAGIKHPGADNLIVSRERVHTLDSALAALGTAAPETPHG